LAVVAQRIPQEAIPYFLHLQLLAVGVKAQGQRRVLAVLAVAVGEMLLRAA
jgi:hypothetical protein